MTTESNTPAFCIFVFNEFIRLMSFKEVNRLRKSGKIEEAFQMATADLKKEPENIWAKRAMSWVCYGRAKRVVENNDTAGFLTQLEQISKLDLPSDETMLADSMAWQIGKLLYRSKADSIYLDKLFNLIKNMPFSKPKEQYSFMLKAFGKYADEWDGFTDFVEWWDLSNLQDADYVEFVTEKGNKIPSTAEMIYVKISKKLLLKPYDREAIKKFIPKIAKVAGEHKNMQYPPYYHAKLLIALGDKQHFLEAFLPFARKKKRDFWVWDLMSEAYESDSAEYFSCLCKSLACGAPDKFTVNVREKLAGAFVARNMLPEAKYEYNKIIEVRQKEGWPLTQKHNEWPAFPWWQHTTVAKSNADIYESNKQTAMSLLFADTPEEILCVESVNNQKSIINFVVSMQKHGFTSYKGFDVKPKAGDVLAVRFAEKPDEKSSFYKVLSVRKTDQVPPPEIYKKTGGRLRIKPGNSFGFVNDVFFPSGLIEKNELKNNDAVEFVALLTHNRKKKDRGWKAIKILNIHKEK